MRYLLFLLLLGVMPAGAQTVTILPTSAMIGAEAEYVSLGGDEYAIISPNKYSEEDLAVVRYHQKPGNDISRHLHYDTDEYFFVIGGEMTMTIRDSTFVAGPNTFIHIPAGTPHAHQNEGEKLLDVLLMYRPGNMAELFRAWGRLVASGITDDEALRRHLLELPEDYDVEFIEQ